MDQEDLDRRFNFHPADTRGKQEAHEDLRRAARIMAGVFDELCPGGREKSIAVTKLEEAMMWGNAAIARLGVNED